MIKHSVVFSLKYPKGSEEEKVFLSEVEKLRSIVGVENFQCLHQISKKSPFQYGIFMEFTSHKVYENYNNHPKHVAFVKNYWMKYVNDFMELDFEKIQNQTF